MTHIFFNVFFFGLCRVSLPFKITLSSSETDTQWNKHNEARKRLASAVEAWYKDAVEFLPQEALEYFSERAQASESAEKLPLGLPSDFTSEEREQLGLVQLAHIERELRIGYAHDTLKKLRTSLGLKSFLVRRKRGNPGYTMATRAETEIKKAAGYVKKWRALYDRNWKALESLRGTDSIPAQHIFWRQLRKLEKADCIMLSKWMDDHEKWRTLGERREMVAAQIGEGAQELPWIWKTEFNFQDESPDAIQGAVQEWTDEGLFEFLLNIPFFNSLMVSNSVGMAPPQGRCRTLG